MASNAPTKHRNGYRVRYWGDDGKRHWGPTRPTEKAALLAAQDAEADVRRGAWINPGAGAMTFGEYFAHWIERRKVSPNTRWTYHNHYAKPVGDREPMPFGMYTWFAHKKLSAIDVDLVQRWVDAMEASGRYEAGTIRAKYKHLQTILAAKSGASAQRDKLIRLNPCEGVDLPDVYDKEVDVFRGAEVKTLIRAMPVWWKPMILLDAASGMRWGELLGLRVCDLVEQPNGRLRVHVRRTVNELTIDKIRSEHQRSHKNKDGSMQTCCTETQFLRRKTTKGKRSRDFEISDTASQAMRHLIATRALGPSDRLFSMPDPASPGQPLRTGDWPEGLPPSRSHFRTVWRRVQDEAGVTRLDDPERTPYRSVHKIRGSHITWTVSGKKAKMHEVMERVGQREWTTTRRYVGRLPEADQRNLRAAAEHFDYDADDPDLDDLLGRSAKATKKKKKKPQITHIHSA